MSDFKEKYNAYNAKAKVDHYCRKSDGKVDASDYDVPDDLDAEKQVNRQPRESIIVPARKPRKAGGMVGGGAAQHNAGRTKRKSGGRVHKLLGGIAGGQPAMQTGGGGNPMAHNGNGHPNPMAQMQPKGVDAALAWRPPSWWDSSMANMGGTGAAGSGTWENPSGGIWSGNAFGPNGRMLQNLGQNNFAKGGAIKAQSPKVSGTRPTGGRIAKAGGGRTKGKTNINIIIAQPKPTPPPAPPMTGPPPMPPMAPQGGPGVMPPPSMQPPGGPPPMMRKDGGKVYPDMDHAAGGGLGRMEKARKYGP